MTDVTLKRGAIPSHRSTLAAAVPYHALIGAPPNFIMMPQKISMWGNDVHGDCVTAEEAFAKACNNPEIFISDAEVMQWATNHGVLEGAYLTQVMTWMQNDGFVDGATVYDDGPYAAVNWTDAATLQSAISRGPVKIGIAADQIETAWRSTSGATGWFATGFHTDTNEDHCVALCGYGSIAWLAQQLNVAVPGGIDGTKPGYALFTWNSIGIIDVPSMLAITQEAWLRQPTTIVVLPPQWHLADLSAETGAPAAASAPHGYMFDAQGTQHVVFQGTDGHVRELWWDTAGGWHLSDLTAATSAPGAASAPHGYMFDAQGTQHVVFQGTDSHVHELWWDNIGGWHAADLTAVTGAPGAASAPHGYMFDAQGTQHVVFQGTDGHVHELWWQSSDGWHMSDLTAVTGVPAAASAPHGYMFDAQGTQHVVFQGTDGHVHELWWEPSGGWHTSDLTAVTGAPAAASAPHGYMFDAQGTQHVVFQGTDGHVRELWWQSSDGWHLADLSAETGAPAAASAPFGYMFDAQGTQHVVFQGTDGHVHELWWEPSGGWHLADLSAETGAPAAVSAPYGYMFDAQGTQHVVFQGADGHVRELWWSPS